MTHETDSPAGPARRRYLPIVIGGVVGAVLAGQTAALVVQQRQISDLRARTAVPGPQGPAGAQGPAGPQGPQGPAGPAGKTGRDGSDGAPAVISGPAAGNGRAAAMTQVEARAHCTEQAAGAWPEGKGGGDVALDQLTGAYTATQRDRAFRQCMSDEGWPQ